MQECVSNLTELLFSLILSSSFHTWSEGVDWLGDDVVLPLFELLSSLSLLRLGLQLAFTLQGLFLLLICLSLKTYACLLDNHRRRFTFTAKYTCIKCSNLHFLGNFCFLVKDVLQNGFFLIYVSIFTAASKYKQNTHQSKSPSCWDANWPVTSSRYN